MHPRQLPALIAAAGTAVASVGLVALAVPSALAAAASVAPAAGTVVPITPARILDTRRTLRSGVGAGRSIIVSTAPAHVPSTASAVVLSVTAVTPTVAGALTVSPYGSPLPSVYSASFPARTSTTSTVLTAIRSGRFVLADRAARNLNVTVDVTGYVAAATDRLAGTLHAFAPARVRSTTVAARGAVDVDLSGRLPSGASAALLTVTALRPRVAGGASLSARGGRTSVPLLTFAAGTTTTAQTLVALSGGHATLRNAAASAVGYDVELDGYVLGGSSTVPGGIVAIAPTRALDTRRAGGIHAGHTADLGAVAGVPATATALVATVTVVSPARAGALRLYAPGIAQPAIGQLGFAAGRTSATLAVLPVAAHHAYLANAAAASTNVLIDVTGYRTGITAPVASTPVTTPAPVAVSGLQAVASTGSVALSWVNPTTPAPAAVVVARAVGTVAPSSPTGGVRVTGSSWTDTAVSPATTYSYSAFTTDSAGRYSPATAVTARTVADTTAPGPVTALSATAGSSSATLSWTDPTDADLASVTVVRGTGTAAPRTTTDGTVVSTTLATTVTDTGLAPRTSYVYGVFARDTSGNTAPAATVRVTTAAALLPVTGLTARANATGAAPSVTLSWVRPSNSAGTSAVVVRTSGATPPASVTGGTQVATVTGTSVTDTAVNAKTVYSYGVFATDGAGHYATPATLSFTTAADSVPTGPVTGLTSTLNGTGTTTSVRLAWTNPTDSDLASVVVVRRSGTYQPRKVTDGTVLTTTTGTAFTDLTASANTTYSYGVIALDRAGNYSTAAALTLTTPVDTVPPAAVSSLKAVTNVATAPSLVTLSWTPPATDVASIRVRRNTGTVAPSSISDGAGISWLSPTATGATDPWASPTAQYTYSVFTVDAAGNVSRAATVTVTLPVDLSPPGPVTSLAATPATGEVDLSWVRPSEGDYAGVRVYRSVGTAVPTTASTFVGDLNNAALTMADTTVSASTVYTYAFFTRDWAGNVSPSVASVTVTTPAAPASSGSITGTVSSAGAGLAGALVSVSDTAGDNDSAYTDAAGHYLVDGLAPGFYTVCVSGADAVGGSHDSWGYLGSCAAPLTVPVGAATSADVVLASAAAVSGRVTAVDGSGLAGVAVTVTPAGSGTYATGTTDSTGRFVVGGLDGDTYTVCLDGASATGGPSRAGYLRVCSVVTGIVGTSTDASGVLGAAAAVAGTLTSSGSPVSGTAVTALDTSTYQTFSATSDANGSYVLRGLTAGDSYTVCSGGGSSAFLYTCSGPVQLVLGLPASADMALTVGASISGTVLDPTGAPVAGATVTATMPGHDPVIAFADSSGHYTVGQLPAGPYSVCFGGGWGAPYVEGCTTGPVPVTAGGIVTGIDRVLTPAGVVSGYVAQAGGGLQPLAGVSVSVTGSSATATTDAGGYYALNLPAGSWSVCFSGALATGGSADPLGYGSSCSTVTVQVGASSDLSPVLAARS